MDSAGRSIASTPFYVGLTTGETRHQLVSDLQRAIGNASVSGLIAQRFSDKQSGEEPVTPGALVPKLLLHLVPGSPDPAVLMAIIEAASVSERRSAYDNTALRQLVMSRFSGTDREQVMAGLLAGKPYVPGTISILYKELAKSSPHERSGIDTAVNARFLAETGISRPLDWNSHEDKPLARRWLELRDLVADAVIVRPDRLKSYEEYLKEAVNLLGAAEYGRASGWAVGEDTDDKYDLDYWEEVPDEQVMESEGKGLGMLRLKPGVRPSLAIDELFAKLDKWAFDCAEFVQVAHLYAMRHTMGELAFERILAADAGKAEVLLRSHGSTGLKSRVLYERDWPEEPMREFYTGKEIATPVDQILEEAPIGSRVVWRNLAASDDDDIFNENSIKLGPDQFAAHGLDPDRRKIVFTRDELELELARRTWTLGGDPDRTEIETNVFIRTIQHYIVP